MPTLAPIRGLDDIKAAIYFLADDLPATLFSLCIMLPEPPEILAKFCDVRPINLAVQVLDRQGHKIDARPSRYTFEDGFIMITEPLFPAGRAGPLPATRLDPEHVPTMGAV